MRRLIAALTLVVACGIAAADDTDSQANMRKAVKATKISVDWKDALMQDVAKELAEKLEETGKVKGARVRVDSIVTGLTQNMKVSLTVKDKPVADVLEELCKKYNLGYVILGKQDAKSKYKAFKKKEDDGTLLLTKGDKERGDPKD
ncbi:MAG: STN domain-containing protein [Gemmataceae bacterium]|nr:STN domain-containing protein [Gemmataceae bacterium]